MALVVTGVLIINTKNNDKLGINKFLAAVGANKNLSNAGENTNNTNGTNTTDTTPAINGEPSEKQKNTPVNNPITNALTDTENVKIYTDKNGDKVPIPKGYVGSQVTGENIVSTGYVIYEGTDDVTGNFTDDIVQEAQKTRNQYVWVPVLNVEQLKEKGDVLSLLNYDNDYTLELYNLKIQTKHELLADIEKQYQNSQESIKKYGGFYIGRYELGDVSQTIPVVRKRNDDIGNKSWYDVYPNIKNIDSKNDNVEISIIRNDLQNRTLDWLIETGNKTTEQVNTDSGDCGNYRNSDFVYEKNNGESKHKDSGSSVRIPTGCMEFSKANNIYDLAGNVWEWSLEVNSSGRRGWQGGSCYYTSSQNPAKAHAGYKPDANNGYDYGFRVALYIK